jgi:hypothetical protein
VPARAQRGAGGAVRSLQSPAGNGIDRLVGRPGTAVHAATWLARRVAAVEGGKAQTSATRCTRLFAMEVRGPLRHAYRG